MHRLRLKPEEEELLKEIRSEFTINETHRYRLSPEEFEFFIEKRNEKSNNRHLKEVSEEVGFEKDQVHYYWIKTSKGSYCIKPNQFVLKEELIKDVINEVVTSPPKKIKVKEYSEEALKATFTDAHVGMNPSSRKNSLFQYEYNEEIFNKNIDIFLTEIIKEADGKTFEVFYLDDLGDGLDGYNKQTVRGGHNLQQNMNNVEQFEAYIKGKSRLIKTIIESKIAKKVIIRSVVNDNHSGSFSHIANLTIKLLMQQLYSHDTVTFEIFDRFMQHYFYGDHCFILTHGKDDEFMFRGLPLKLDARATKFVNDYIDHYEIKSKYIHLEKGDLHQCGLDRTKKFDYRNFMSFAPPSEHVRHNYGDCYSGFAIQRIPKHSSGIGHKEVLFNMKKEI